MRAQRLLTPLFLMITLCGAACISSALEPVEIYPEDVCKRCKMAISDKRFAGEILIDVGVARKFDDLGCLLKDLKAGPVSHEPAAFAVDFRKGEWVNVREAYYVKSPHISTPMGSGLIAFKNRSDAEQEAAKYGADVLNYGDVVKSVGR
ncbi:MAG: hypothetical protein EHM23_08825 [Acidobacteria bacterium]|nr:MAG: hypothetical protein EHM23_08825 [Acidobacteriota bacterium]